jgi:hypothetical protein
LQVSSLTGKVGATPACEESCCCAGDTVVEF